MEEDKTLLKNRTDTLRMPPKEAHKADSPESDNTNLGFPGYTILNRLSASSGEAEIFLATKNNQRFVIKYYYPNFSPKYEILERLKGIQHPDILPLHEFGKHKDRFFEVQEYAEGGTLGDKKEDGTYRYLPLSEEKLIGVLQEVLNAFEFFHSKGIIHRDIKPANLFYKNADGSDILVGDFGISSRINVDEDMTKRNTKSQSRTEGYAAPEIYSGIIGKELDYYSLGITIFELHTGTYPFRNRNEGHIIRDTIEGRVIEDLLSRPEAKNFSKKIQTLLSGLLTLRHDKRWGLSEVKRFLNGESVEVFKPPIKDIKPLIINGQNYTDLKEIASVLEKDRTNGKKLFYRGMLSRWAEGIDLDLAGKIADIQEETAEIERQDFGFQRLLFFLNPENPYRSASGMEIKNREDFQKLLKSGSKEVITELKQELSMLNAWLYQNGLGEIQTLVKKALSLGYSQKRTLLYIRLSLYEGFALPDGGRIFKPEELLNLPTKTMNQLYTELKEESSELSVWFEVTDPERYRLWKGMEKSLENFLDLLSGEWIKKESERKAKAEEERKKADEQKKQELPKTYTNFLGMEFILIPAGEFMMGAVPQDREAEDSEEPQHKVRITKPFYIGKYPVTQGEWEALMGENRSKFIKAGKRAPVENVNWNDCQGFIKKLSKREGKQYRLPTEAEWEYAARGGLTNNIYTYGDDEDKLIDYAWYDKNSGSTTHPVGEKKPNSIGLYDMMGNIREWCDDWFDGAYYKNSPGADPRGAEKGKFRSLRGGSWGNYAKNCRLSRRDFHSPGYWSNPIGFRLVLCINQERETPISEDNEISINIENKKDNIATSLITKENSLRDESEIDSYKKSLEIRNDKYIGKSEKIITVDKKTEINKELPKNYINSIGMEFVLIPAGEFMMGALPHDREAGYDEKPQHKVIITEPFYIGKYPVTQEEWEKVMGNNPSYFKQAGKRAPVEAVSWLDTQEFIKILGKKEGKTYRLPTEAEWEYAARGGGSGGSPTVYTYGNGANKLGDYAWYDKNSGRTTHPVGEKKPNAIGLYDIMGNVWEWCEDWFSKSYYGKFEIIDPKGPNNGKNKVFRGGSWYDAAWNCRVSNRYNYAPGSRDYGIGFRLLLPSHDGGRGIVHSILEI